MGELETSIIDFIQVAFFAVKREKNELRIPCDH